MKDEPRPPKRIKTDLGFISSAHPQSSQQPKGAGQAQRGQQAAKDPQRDIVCIGQLTSTAFILYRSPYVYPKPDQPLVPTPPAASDGYVPVRLKYDFAAKERQRNLGRYDPSGEMIQILMPYGTPGTKSGTKSLGREEFGVVEQRTAVVLGPLMEKVLIRLKAHVQRATTTTSTEPILPLRILVFTPRGNVKVVATYLHSGGVALEHPSIPYIPSEHRDNPPYENPHQAGDVGASDYRYNNTVPNGGTSQAVSGKSVEVQSSRETGDHQDPSDSAPIIVPPCKAASKTTKPECATNQNVLGETSDVKAPSSIISVSQSRSHHEDACKDFRLDPPRVRVLESKATQTIDNPFQKCQRGIQTDSVVLSRVPPSLSAAQSNYAVLSASEFDNECKARMETEKQWQRKMEEIMGQHAALVKMCMEKLAPS